MKLGVCYNCMFIDISFFEVISLVFDGEELLESSILSIRNVVDHICVVYQTKSNYNQPCNPHLESFLKYLKEGIQKKLSFGCQHQFYLIN